MCGGASFDVDIECPAALPSISTSPVKATNDCEGELTQVHYFASVTGSSTIDVHDYLFLDPNGQFAATDGYYIVNDGGDTYKIEVINGIVVSISGCCAPDGSIFCILEASIWAPGTGSACNNFGALVYRVRTNNGSWTAPTSGSIYTYQNWFGSNPNVILDGPHFGACIEVEIGTMWGTNFYFPTDPGWPGWWKQNQHIQGIAVWCINSLNPPPPSTSPCHNYSNYQTLMSPDLSTAYAGTDRYGNPVTAYWRFTLGSIGWLPGPTTFVDPVYGLMGPQTNLRMELWEPI